MDKLPGKTLYSGRRRAMSRKSGFKVAEGSTGGEFKILFLDNYSMQPGSGVDVVFTIPYSKIGCFVGFGLWYCATNAVSISIPNTTNIDSKITFTQPCSPNWSKIGSMWTSKGKAYNITLSFTSSGNGELALWGMGCGIIEHKHLSNARTELLPNMYEFAPESNFYIDEGDYEVRLSQGVHLIKTRSKLYLKSCNRCARFLPINVNDQRKHLSFTNHCVAVHRRPCSHTGFGKLRNIESGEYLQLDYGFQLECRFCKKFEVNAAHNPKRTASQMKEDATRRRSFELLLTDLYGGSPQLVYRHKTGKELTEVIWNKFGRKCFKCNNNLPTANSMNLDHTRPLALLWPLDDTATALCKDCNTEKRDRPPVEYYSDEELRKLSKITGLDYDDLKDPSPNLEALALLEKQLDWFFNHFLTKPELTKVRDGKTAGELLVKALQKVIDKTTDINIDLISELELRRG